MGDVDKGAKATRRVFLRGAATAVPATAAGAAGLLAADAVWAQSAVNLKPGTSRRSIWPGAWRAARFSS